MIERSLRETLAWRWTAPIILLGLTLRLASAQGALWLDEAWSVLHAHEAGTPLGIFLNINHDNNHHLNSLWLLAVGFDAAPIVQRGLAIVTGTAGIGVAAAIGARRGYLVAALTALLFAVSPVMVTMGSEARGYAPMVLALLFAILLTDRWLAGDAKTDARVALALSFFLGALSQLTMIFGFCAVAGWVWISLLQRRGWRSATTETTRLLFPSACALALVAAIVFGAAANSVTGFQFGSYVPFAFADFVHGLAQLIGFTTGWPNAAFWAPLVVIAVVAASHRFEVARPAFSWLAIVVFPLAITLLRTANAGHPRYYLLAAIALLLLAADLLGAMIVAGRWRRWVGLLVLSVFLIGSAQQDALLIHNQRGDPGPAIRAMQMRSPMGARIALDRNTALAVMEVAGAHAHYPLVIQGDACPPAPFVYTDRFGADAIPPEEKRCGTRYRLVAHAYADGMSGTHWGLYQRSP